MSKKTVLVIDVGSSMVQGLLCEVENSPRGCHLQVLDRTGAFPCLAEGIAQTGSLSGEAMQRALDCVQNTLSILGSHAQKVITTTTSAVRTAKNGQEFMNRLAKLLPEPPKQLSGRLEAELGHRGAASAVAVAGAGAGAGVGVGVGVVTIDIGGGSTELAVSLNNDILYAQSTEIGIVRVSDQFNATKHALSYQDVNAIATHIQDTLRPAAAAARASLSQLRLVVADAAIAEVFYQLNPAKQRPHAQAQRTQPVRLGAEGVAPDFSGDRSQLKELAWQLLRQEPGQREVGGIGVNYFTFNAIAMLILDSVMKLLGVETYFSTSRGLREGLAMKFGCE